MADQKKINWYRCKVDKAVMSELMRKNDARAHLQAIGHLALFAVTGTLAYLAFRHVNAGNWPWALPVLLVALFAHGTVGSFIGGGVACHELCHKTPFANQFWNSFFLKVYSFLGWFDPIGYRASHIRHHQATTHVDQDGEVVLPYGLNWHGVSFVLGLLVFNPVDQLKRFRFWIAAACGDLSKATYMQEGWLERVVPDVEGRREIRNWAWVVLFGHLALAGIFIATGHWFLIVIVNFGCFYASWLAFLCGAPQHIGLCPDTPDFRLCTRTFTCGWLPAFLYWNMQYHAEHHMFPAVPFYNLPRLRKAIEHDMPPAPHGLWATWREIIPIVRRQRKEPTYFYRPPLPGEDGDHVGDDALFCEAASLKPVGNLEEACRGGFSLIEIVMAMGIVSFAFVSVLGLIPMGMANFRSSIDASVSAQINQQVIGQAQETDFNSLPLLSGSTFYFDVDGRQLSGASGSVYQARAWVNQAATLPGAPSANSNISTVTVQIANNPSNQSLTPDPGTHLWKAQSGVIMRTFSTLVSGYCIVTGSTGS